MAEEFFVRQLDNGLVLLAERLTHVVSAAVQIALPAGAARDGRDLAGAGAVLSDWLFRGAGSRDTRGLNDALDFLGCQHGEHVHSSFCQLSASQTNQNLKPVLELYADIVRRPHLADEAFARCRDLALQELASLEDEPARKCNMRLREAFYPWPIGASPLGTAQALQAMSAEQARAHAQRHLTPRGAILAVAGNFEIDALVGWAEALFGDWTGEELGDVAAEPARPSVTHEGKASAQMQIGLAYRAPRADDTHYYAMRVAEMALSGGMSGRLFTEVREKRGLVYHVSARYGGTRQAAGVFVYAGTTPEKAQQTLDVTLGELRRLSEGITPEELARAKTQLKSALVMQGESTAARASALVSDWHLLGRLRSLDEIAAAIGAVRLEDVLACLQAYPATHMTAYFIGPKALETAALEA